MAEENKEKQTPEQAQAGAPKKDEKKKEEGVLYLGMDLGTSRTAVAASNGARESMFSAVGYPRDIISKKLFKGRDALFGAEALKKRTSLNLYQPLEKGYIKSKGLEPKEAEANKKAAKDILCRALEFARPRKGELTYAVIGAPAQASMENKRLIIDAVRSRVDSVIICSEPFAVAYGLDRLDETLVIDIGAGTVDLCRMHGTMPEPEDQITLDTAGDFVDRQFLNNLKKSYPEAQITIHIVKEIKEKYSTVEETVEPIKVTLFVEGRPKEFDITKELREACLSVVKPMVNALHKLIATFDPEFQATLRNNVMLGGGGSQIRGLDRALEAAMAELGGGRVEKVEEPLYAGSNGALKIAHDMPEEYWEKLS